MGTKKKQAKMISAPVELEGVLCLGDLHLGADPHLGGDDGRGADVAQVAQAIRKRREFIQCKRRV